MNIMCDPIYIINEKNKLITEEYIYSIFNKYGIKHKINNMEGYIEATTHTSYCIKSYTNTDEDDDSYHKIKNISTTKAKNPNKALQLREKSYERLEYLGDAVIHTILAEYIFVRFVDQQEGFMTKLRTRMEDTETLSKFTQYIGLDTYILLSRHAEETNTRTTNDHVLEDVFEAFIGALYSDGEDTCNNFMCCRSLVIKLVESIIDIAELLSNETNYKDILLRYAHSKKLPDPIYGTRKMYGIDNKMFEMFVVIGKNECGYGVGNSKKKGEQAAAKMALEKFKYNVEGTDFSDDDDVYE